MEPTISSAINQSPPDIPLTESESLPPQERFRSLLNRLPSEYEPPDPDSPRGRIIYAARKLFADHGFAATSIRAIADSSEVNLAMVHYYYGTKEDLYRRVIVAELVNAFRKIREDLPPNLTPDQLVLSFPLHMAKVMRDNPIWAQLIRRELAEGAPNARAVFDELGVFGPHGFKGPMMAAYESGVKGGKLKPIPSASVLPLMISIGYGMVLLEPLLKVVIGEDIINDQVWEGRIDAMRELFESGLKLGAENKNS